MPEKKGLLSKIGGFFSGAYQTIKSGVSKTATYVKDTTVNAYNSASEYVHEKTRNYYWYEKIVNPENRYKQSYWQAAKTNTLNFVLDKGKVVAQSYIDYYMDDKSVKDSWQFENKDIIFGKRVEKKQNIFSKAKNKVMGSIAGYGTKVAKDYAVDYVNNLGKAYNVTNDVVRNVCFENNTFALSDKLKEDLSVMKSYYGISFSPEKMFDLLNEHAKKLENNYNDVQWRKQIMPSLLKGAYANALSDCMEEYFSSSMVPHSEKQSKEEMLYISGMIGEVFGQYSEWLANNTEYLEAPITHMDRDGLTIEKAVPQSFFDNNKNLTNEQKAALSNAVKGTLQDRKDIERIVSAKYQDLTKNQAKSFEKRFDKNLENLTKEKLNDPKYADVRKIVLATSRQFLANIEKQNSKRGFLNRHLFARSAANAEKKQIADMKAKMKSLGFTDEEITADPSVLISGCHVQGLDNGSLFNDTKRREFLEEKIREIEHPVTEKIKSESEKGKEKEEEKTVEPLTKEEKEKKDEELRQQAFEEQREKLFGNKKLDDLVEDLVPDENGFFAAKEEFDPEVVEQLKKENEKKSQEKVDIKEPKQPAKEEEEEVYEDALSPEEYEAEQAKKENIEKKEPVKQEPVKTEPVKAEPEKKEPEREKIDIFADVSKREEKLQPPVKHVVMAEAQLKLMQDDAQNDREAYWYTYWNPYNKKNDQYSFNQALNDSIKDHSNGLTNGDYDQTEMFDDEGGKFKERAKDQKTFRSDVKDNIEFLARAYHSSKLYEYSQNDSFPKNYKINSKDTLLATVNSPETEKYIKGLPSKNDLFLDAVMDTFKNTKSGVKDLSDMTRVVENIDFTDPENEDTKKFSEFFKGVDKVFQANIMFEATKNKGKEIGK